MSSEKITTQDDGAFFNVLKMRCDELGTLLCVGLDPHVKQLPEATPAAAEKHSLDLIAATKEYAACYKPNAAFFECFGEDGVAALKRVVSAAKAVGAPVLLDAKRGDIGTTSEAYATAAFDELGVDAITLSPYMGSDSIEPFVGLREHGATRGAFVLCKTSNKSSADIQTLRVTDSSGCSRRVFEHVAAMTIQGDVWNKHSNVGIVVGATDLEAMEAVRRINPTVWILAPGVGAQGGDIESCCRAALRPDGSGLLVAVSRGISSAADPREAARQYRDAINRIREEKRLGPAPGGLQQYQKEFVEQALAAKVLRFGSFELKSGRQSPYFFNAGLFNTGAAQACLCSAYAARIVAARLKFDVIFGPAYKGISLAAGVAAALFTEYAIDVGYAYNRKEPKDHGEGGVLVGADVVGQRCLLVDDVISAGTAIREAKGILDQHGATLVGVVIALDRQERTGKDEELTKVSAVQSVQDEFGVPVMSIIDLDGLLNYLHDNGGLSGHIENVRAYREKYGVA